jgi:hypothetical protein
MDEFGATDLKSAYERLESARARRRFRRLAQDYEVTLPRLQEGGINVVAGSGLDLTGALDCMHPQCRLMQVSKLFRGAWHYFDRVVVGDTLTHSVANHWDKSRGPQFEKWLIGEMGFFCLLRQMGADRLIDFVTKRVDHRSDWREHVRETCSQFSPEIAIPDTKQLIDILQTRARVRVDTSAGGETTFAVEHPDLEHTRWVTVIDADTAALSDAVLKRQLLERVAETYVKHLVYDQIYARFCKAPLAATMWAHHQLLTHNDDDQLASAIFQLDLPVVDSVPIPLLLKIRKDEADAFERFRGRLRQAFRESLSERKNSKDLRKAAVQIRRDIIDPELREIRVRLKKGTGALKKKSAIGMVLGGLATTCGLLAGAPGPVAVSAGVAVATAALATGSAKLVDERSEVTMSNMYFLWKALKHAKHRRSNRRAG